MSGKLCYAPIAVILSRKLSIFNKIITAVRQTSKQIDGL